MLTKISKLITYLCLFTSSLVAVPCGNFVGEITGDPDGGTFPFSPTGIAIADDGRIYVTEIVNMQVQVFDACGNFLFSFGDSSLISAPYDVAVSKKNHIYVVDADSNRVQVFDSCGNYLSTLGEGTLFTPFAIAVGPGGKIYVSDFNPAGDIPRIQVYDACGNFLNSIESNVLFLNQISQLAISPQGLIYAVNSQRVTILDACLNFVGTIDEEVNFIVTGIAFNSDGSFNIAVLDNVNPFIRTYDRCGNPLANFGAGILTLQFPFSNLAVSPKGLVYVCDFSNQRIAIFQ